MKTEDYCDILSELYSATFRDWNLTISVCLTEPTCPTISITPEDKEMYDLTRYTIWIDSDDDIDKKIKSLCRIVKREVIDLKVNESFETLI